MLSLAAVTEEGADGTISSARIVLGYVADRPIRAKSPGIADLIAAHRAAAAKHSIADQRNIFWNTAERIYRPA